MDLHLYIHVLGDTKTTDLLLKQGELIMAAIDDLNVQLDAILADVTSESTKIDSLSTFMQGLKDQLAAALANQGVSQAIIDKSLSIFTAAEANKAKIDAAIAANTPPTP